MAKNGTYNGQKRVGAEQSSYYREHPVDFGQKRKKVGVGQSDMASNTLCRYCFQVHPFLAKKHWKTPFLITALDKSALQMHTDSTRLIKTRKKSFLPQ